MKFSLFYFAMSIAVVIIAIDVGSNANAVHVPNVPEYLENADFKEQAEVKRHPSAQASYLEMQVKLMGDTAIQGIKSGLNDIFGGDVDVPIFSGHENGGNCYCCGCEVSCRECKRDFDVCCTV